MFWIIIELTCTCRRKCPLGWGFRVVQIVHMAPWGPSGRAPIAFLIDDIPLGAPQGVYVNSGERLAPWGSCLKNKPALLLQIRIFM